MPYTYEYPRPMVTADIVPFAVREGELRALLIRRGRPPFEGRWALPGGFVEMDEDLDAAARREMKEETGVELAHLEQLATYGTPGRDPRGRTVTVAWLGIVYGGAEAKAADDAAASLWCDPTHPLPLAFDHDLILAHAVAELRRRVRFGALLLPFLEPPLTVSRLAECASVVMGREVPSDALRRRLARLGVLAPRGASGRCTLAENARALLEAAGGLLGERL
jgi:8-oxo-dGTP diphosphatase